MIYELFPHYVPRPPLPRKVGVMTPQLLWERRPCHHDDDDDDDDDDNDDDDDDDDKMRRPQCVEPKNRSSHQ